MKFASSHRQQYHLLALIGIFAGLTWVYWFGLFVAYDYHDAFYVYAVEQKNSCSQHPQWGYFFYIGRPLYAVLNCYFVDMNIYAMSDTVFVRQMAFALLCGSAMATHLLISRIGYGFTVSLSVAFAVGTLPGVQLFLFLTPANTIFFSLPCVLAASLLFYELTRVTRNIWSFRPLIITTALSGGVVICLLLGSLIYQQFSSLFFVFAGLCVLSRRGMQSITHACAVMMLATLLYALHGVFYLYIFDAYVFPYYAEFVGPDHLARDAETFGITATSQPLQKIAYMFITAIPVAMQLWAAGSGFALSSVVWLALLISGAAWLWTMLKSDDQVFMRDRVTGDWSNMRSNVTALARVVLTLTILIGIMVLANTPNLISDASSTRTRHLFVLQVMIVAIIASGIERYSYRFMTQANRGYVLGSLAALIFAGMMISKHHYTHNFVNLATAEFNYVRAEMLPAAQGDIETVSFIVPDVRSLALAPSSRSAEDEFGKLTSMFPQDVPWFLLAAHLANGGARETFPSVTVLTKGENFASTPQPKNLQIDMRTLVGQILHERHRSAP